MSPYEKAQAILADLVARAAAESPEPRVLPSIQYAQIGAPRTVTCESLVVGAATVAADGADDSESIMCDAIQVGTFMLVYALDCSWTSDEDGTDNPELVAEVSGRVDAAGDFLWAYANELDPFLSKEWSLGFTMTGGLGIATLTLTTGID